MHPSLASVNLLRLAAPTLVRSRSFAAPVRIAVGRTYSSSSPSYPVGNKYDYLEISEPRPGVGQGDLITFTMGD